MNLPHPYRPESDRPPSTANTTEGSSDGQPNPAATVDWLNFGFLACVHLLAASGLLAYSLADGWSFAAVAIGALGTVSTVFGISAGYHRLFSHRSYETGTLLRGLLLVLGATSFQTSALTWASAHRRHHRHVDTNLDPYNARRGFWYSHIGWVLERKVEPVPAVPVPDLEKDPLLRWQHRFVIPIGVFFGLVLPGLIGWLYGDPWGGFLLGGLLRLVVTYHLTFSINSLVHKFGTQPYSERSSARDSVLAALLTMGEGYHNYHHAFPADYRNGAGRHAFDPTKWTLRVLERLGLVWNVKRTPTHVIARARVRVDQARIQRLDLPAASRTELDRAAAKLHQGLSAWARLVRERSRAARPTANRAHLSLTRDLDVRLSETTRAFQRCYRAWRVLTSSMERTCVQQA